jgi:hypothetical protein
MAFGLSLPVSIAGRFKTRVPATARLRHADEKERQLSDLMLRALDGDAEAYRSALRALVPVIKEFFTEKTGATSNDLEALVHETLIAVHHRRQTYCPDRSLLAWIYAIADHTLSIKRKNDPDKFDAAVPGGRAPFSTRRGISAQARTGVCGISISIGAQKGQCHTVDAQEERRRRSRSEPTPSIAKR